MQVKVLFVVGSCGVQKKFGVHTENVINGYRIPAEFETYQEAEDFIRAKISKMKPNSYLTFDFFIEKVFRPI